jgi:hypothetical protein
LSEETLEDRIEKLEKGISILTKVVDGLVDDDRKQWETIIKFIKTFEPFARAVHSLSKEASKREFDRLMATLWKNIDPKKIKPT